MMVTGMRDSVPAKARQRTMITQCFNWGNHAMALQTNNKYSGFNNRHLYKKITHTCIGICRKITETKWNYRYKSIQKKKSG